MKNKVITQEEKELLLKDLCTKLQYGVKILVPELINTVTFTVIGVNNINSSIPRVCCIKGNTQAYIEIPFTCKILPYLRPMSSMTEEERKEYELLANRCIVTSIGFIHLEAAPLTDWMNKHHFDYRGLIEKGLSLEAPEGMYN